MPWYWIISPEYMIREPVLDDGSGPDVPTCDVVPVFVRGKDTTKTRRRALVAGVQQMRQRRDCEYIRDAWDCNPFTGLRVERWTRREVKQREYLLEVDRYGR